MEKDFHYYLIYAVAKTTGFPCADIIANASQFVDDNNEGQFMIDNEVVNFPIKISTGGGFYYPIMTQSLSPKSLDCYIQKYVYVPFHFIPGNNAVIINGRANLHCTTPGSPFATTLLNKALESDNPYQIGIALHSFADTWSHQNFTGFQESWNAVYPWYQVFKSIVPNIGHAEAGHSPDVISETWTDHRIKQKIDNKDRAFEAVAEIYKTMRLKSGKGPCWEEIQGDFEVIIDAKDYDDRKEKIEGFLTERRLDRAPSYLKDDWIDSALDKKKGQVVMHEGFENTSWFHFHQAAKAHFAIVMGIIKGL